ncbi:hypothetical protein BaRGS_00030350, partial [Batillaria attramentaria]
ALGYPRLTPTLRAALNNLRRDHVERTRPVEYPAIPPQTLEQSRTESVQGVSVCRNNPRHETICQLDPAQGRSFQSFSFGVSAITPTYHKNLQE